MTRSSGAKTGRARPSPPTTAGAGTPAPGLITSRTTGLLAALAALAAAALGGCAGTPATRVSVLNETERSYFVAAWPASADGPGAQAEVLVGPDASRAIALDGLSAQTGVVSLRVTEAAEGDAGVQTGEPTELTLEPPGPFLIRLQNDGRGGTVILADREPSAPAPEPVPPDPRREGFNSDIPPPSPSF